MDRRPFIEPRIRLLVKFPSAEELFTPSNQDSIEAEVNRLSREEDVVTTGKHISLIIDGDTLIFDLNDDVTNVRELSVVQDAIIQSLDNIINHKIEESEVVVEAHIQKVLAFGL